jgi:hypothetical protein
MGLKSTNTSRELEKMNKTTDGMKVSASARAVFTGTRHDETEIADCESMMHKKLQEYVTTT